MTFITKHYIELSHSFTKYGNSISTKDMAVDWTTLNSLSIQFGCTVSTDYRMLDLSRTSDAVMLKQNM